MKLIRVYKKSVARGYLARPNDNEGIHRPVYRGRDQEKEKIKPL